MFDTNERALSLQGEKIQPTPIRMGQVGEAFFNSIGNEGYDCEFQLAYLWKILFLVTIHTSIGYVFLMRCT
jgi:hypothetical protein